MRRPTMPAPPSAILSAVALLATAAVAVLVDGVRERGDLSAYDPAVTLAVVADRAPALTTLADTASLVGSEAVVGALTVALLAWTVWRRRWRAAGLVTAAMGSSVVLTVVVKHLVARARPGAGLVLGPLDTGFSFPSGHTLNSTVFLGVVALLAAGRVRSAAGRAVLAGAWATGSLVVGLSRIYLGYHWLTDVLAGWSLAVAVLAGTAILAVATRPAAIVAVAGGE